MLVAAFHGRPVTAAHFLCLRHLPRLLWQQMTKVCVCVRVEVGC